MILCRLEKRVNEIASGNARSVENDFFTIEKPKDEEDLIDFFRELRSDKEMRSALVSSLL